MADQLTWVVAYGTVTPPAPVKRPARDPYCKACGLSLDRKYGGHHPGCPEGSVSP
jgi:hypothetical protein